MVIGLLDHFIDVAVLFAGLIELDSSRIVGNPEVILVALIHRC